MQKYLKATPGKHAKRGVSRAQSTNPLLASWKTTYEIPPFAKIEARHFRPALEAAFREHREEIKKICANPARPTFANTIIALEKSGRLLTRVGSVFSNLEATELNT